MGAWHDWEKTKVTSNCMLTTPSRKDWVAGGQFLVVPRQSRIFSPCLSFSFWFLLWAFFYHGVNNSNPWRKLVFSSHCSQGHHVFNTWSSLLFFLTAVGPGACLPQDRVSWKMLEINVLESGVREPSLLPEFSSQWTLTAHDNAPM